MSAVIWGHDRGDGRRGPGCQPDSEFRGGRGVTTEAVTRTSIIRWESSGKLPGPSR